MSVVSLRDIEKSFGADSVLKGLGFSLDAGDRVGLVGVNGCGKTTLLEIISGRAKPDGGEMAVARGTT
ncbi:MAG: ATP-binding cassette domain-containing protein, partial [Nitrospirae bacterium]|nr:ATP-binding cassette domain-containing protein [Nitrospirota bacterium]